MDTLQALGIWWILMGAAFAVALVLALVLGAFTAFRFRVPAFLWLVGPTLTLAAGLPPALSGGTRLAEALAYVDPPHRTAISAAGYAEALVGPMLSSLQATTALLVAAATLAVGSAIGARPGRFTPAAAGIAAAVSVVGALGTGLVALLVHESVALGIVPAVGLAGGLAAAVGGLRLGEDRADAARGAAARGAIALLAVLAVVLVATGLSFHARTDVFWAMAYVDDGLRASMLPESWREIGRFGVFGLVTALWVSVAAGAPAIAALPELQAGSSARTAIGAVGSVVVLAVGAGALGGTASWLAGLGAAPEPLLDAARRARDLPLAGEGTNALVGQCLVTPKARGWYVRAIADGVACAEGDLALPIAWDPPLVAVPADTPARLLAGTAWYGPSGGALHLLVRHEAKLPDDLPPMLEAYRWGTLPFEWIAPGAASAGGWRLVDTADGTMAVIGGQPTPLDLSLAVRGELGRYEGMHGAPILVPGPTWTAQDLVDLCVALRADADVWSDTACLLQGAL